MKTVIPIWEENNLLTDNVSELYVCPPLKKEGHIALHMSVGRSVYRYVGIP